MSTQPHDAKKSARSFESPGNVLHLLGQEDLAGLNSKIIRLKTKAETNFIRAPSDHCSFCGHLKRQMLIQKRTFCNPDTMCEGFSTSPNLRTCYKSLEAKSCLCLCFSYSRSFLLW